jgi:putative intracellular protease/amidase
MMTAAQAQKILIVLTSHSQLGDSGNSTGYWLSEVTHFYDVLQQAGYSMDIASPQGGKSPMDPTSYKPTETINARWLADPDFANKMEHTTPVADVQVTDYKIIYFPGGHGPMWDLSQDAAVATITRQIYETGGIVAAVCHGPAALLPIKLSDGSSLLSHHTVSGLRNVEERLSGKIRWVPFLLEDKLRKQAQNYSHGWPFLTHAVTSGRVVTGQNPGSALRVGELVRNLAKQLWPTTA